MPWESSLLISKSPLVMGIINCAPDSFARKGRCTDLDSGLKHAEKLIEEGAGILDIGGEPTNPQINPVTELQDELQRVIPLLDAIRKRFDICLSVDTSKPEVMRAAVEHGADIINDVRALRGEGALGTVADLKVPVCLMHMLSPDGVLNATENDPYQGDVFSAVKNFLTSRIDACLDAGIVRENLIIDPGFGAGSFGKNCEQNFQLLRQLPELKSFDLPILVGLSRKSLLRELLQLEEEERLPGSLALATIAVLQGANIIRAHDVKATVEAVKVAETFKKEK